MSCSTITFTSKGIQSASKVQQHYNSYSLEEKKYGFISNNLKVSKNKNKNKTKRVKDRMKKLRVNRQDLHPIEEFYIYIKTLGCLTSMPCGRINFGDLEFYGFRIDT
jgi:hypothetical protein